MLIDATLNPKITKFLKSKQATGFIEAFPFLTGFHGQPFYENSTYLLQSH